MIENVKKKETAEDSLNGIFGSGLNGLHSTERIGVKDETMA